VHAPLIVYVVVITALGFEFTNGFHDTANAMAASIATGAFRPRVAVAVAAVCNLIGAFLSIKVASTISGGIVDEAKFSHTAGPAIVFAALVGAILWNLATWYFGLPSSSTHALVGALVGATVATLGLHAVNFTTLLAKVVIPAVASPVIAGLAAATATFIAYRTNERIHEKNVSRGFRAGQNLSATLVALAHGTSDGQKTMGIITLTFIVAGVQPKGATPFFWVILICAVTMAVGTFIGGWRIISTLGHGLVDIDSPQGFAAEASAAAAILASTHLGYALSTTHVCSGAVIGSGIGKSGAVIRWNTATRMVTAWLLTLPAAAAVGCMTGKLAFGGGFGITIVAIIGIGGSAGFYFLSRRQPVTAQSVAPAPDTAAAPAGLAASPIA
jgi:inorganic phosphate transporter, PiT family